MESQGGHRCLPHEMPLPQVCGNSATMDRALDESSVTLLPLPSDVIPGKTAPGWVDAAILVSLWAWVSKADWPQSLYVSHRVRSTGPGSEVTERMWPSADQAMVMRALSAHCSRRAEARVHPGLTTASSPRSPLLWMHVSCVTSPVGRLAQMWFRSLLCGLW